MHKHTRVGALVAGLLLGSILPSLVFAQAMSPQDQSSTSSPAVPLSPSVLLKHRVCTVLYRDLAINAKGDDVKALQEFLTSQGFFSGQTTGFYGSVTAQAVAKWQASQGLPAAGSVGPLTRDLIKKLCAPNDAVGLDHKHISATPKEGVGPLTVTFSTWVTSFQVPSISYIIDFGDTQTQAATNCIATSTECSSPGINTHTYLTPGSYKAVLYKVTNPCGANTTCGAPVFREAIDGVDIKVRDPKCALNNQPVCGLKPIVCITTPCNPVPTTYDDMCAMTADNATLSHVGECHPEKPIPPVATSTPPSPPPAPTPNPNPDGHRVCSILTRNLSSGMQGDDVRGLQEFLVAQGNLSAQPTGFFGPLTAQAVAQWQTSQGVSAAGSIGPVSRDRIKKWCDGDVPPTPNKTLSATPTKGAAPLTVHFKANVSISNPQMMADAGSYKITFGDGAEQVFSCTGTTPTCSGPQTSDHTYATNGTYTASLVHYGFFGPAATDGSVTSSSIVDTATITVGTSITEVDPSKDPRCKTWNDGCNTCSRSSVGGPGMCTLMACAATAHPVCTSRFPDIDNDKPPVISSFSGPTTLPINTSGTWSIHASDPEQDQLKYMIQWGDEWYAKSALLGDAVYPGAPIVQSSTFTHSYAEAGNYTVKVLVRNTAGKEAKVSATVHVGQ